MGVDIRQEIVGILNNGDIHIQEPSLHDLVQKAIESGDFRTSLQPESVEAFIIAVPTRFFDNKQADMHAVTSITEAIVPYLRKGDLVISEGFAVKLLGSIICIKN